MAGGSKTREDPTDQRCEHCGLFYSSQGIGTHEPNCPVASLDVDVVPTTVESRGPTEGSDSRGESPDGGDEGVSADSDSETSPGEAVTDGGATGLGLEGPPAKPSTAADDDLEDDEDDEETYDCTDCGADTDLADEDLDAAFSETTDRHGFRGYITCDDCGHRMGWSA